MIYELIELYNYKRFNLTGIKKITIRPNNKMQLILGTNGCGKSSLLSEISPLPISGKKKDKEFDKGGYKRLIINHNNSTYELISTFDTSVKNTFIKDGEILLENGTSPVQRELVKLHFGITPEIHDLIIGKTKFTSMTPSERRKWITELSNVNYDYVLSLYQNAKELLKNKKIILENSIKERMKLEVNRLTEEEHDILILNIKNFKEALEYKINQKRILEHENTKLSNNLTTIDIHNTSKQLIDLITENKLINSLINVKNETSLINQETILKHEYANYRVTKDKLEKELFVLEKELEGYNSDIVVNSDTQITYNTVNNEFNTLLNSLSIKLNMRDLTRYNDFLKSSLDELIDITNNRMIDNSEHHFTKTKYVEQQVLENDLTIQINKVNNEIINTRTFLSKLEDLAKHKITCPNCNHSWANGYDENTHKDVLTKLEGLTNAHKALTLKLDNTKDYLKTYQEHLGLVQNIISILKPIKVALELSLEHITIDVILYDLNALKRIINGFRNDLTKMDTLLILSTRLDRLTDMLEKERLMKDLTLRNKHAAFLVKGKELEELIDKGNKLEKQIKEVNDLITFSTSITRYKNELETLIEQTNNTYEHRNNENKIRIINEVIFLLSNELSRLEKKLNEVDFIEKNIEMITNKIDKLDKEFRAAKLLTRSLSPNEGLIAKSVIGLINNVLLNINNIVKKVWTYDLELLPITPEENDLDYKFKFAINNGEPFDDINLGSSAMSEIINLGFKITAMKYLNMLDYPIYLDEFGHSMDDMHRRQAFYMIDKSLGTAAFSQVFIVSHFSESYGSLSNTDITVLSEDNLMLPFNDFNQATQIEY